MKKGNEFPEEPADEKPVLHVGGVQAVYTENIPKQIQYTALGHLHRMHWAGSDPTPVSILWKSPGLQFCRGRSKKICFAG